MKTLSDWLQHIEGLHPENIELGLERVSSVYAALPETVVQAVVFTVAGTNGKGTTVECLSRCLLAQGITVGTYTSPHLVHFNERIVVNGAAVDDEQITDAFAVVNQARGSVALTYFEFTTLAALYIFRVHQLDAWVLEVGLGGRLDAVNIISPDIAVVTAIGLDHKDWLGNTREQIAQEKAGIMRTDKIAVCSDPNPPLAIATHAHNLNARLLQLGKQFHYQASPSVSGGTWSWNGVAAQRSELVNPRGVVLDNMAGALAALEAAQALPNTNVLNEILASWSLPGRQQIIPGEVEWWLDVAHNLESSQWLASALRENPRDGRCFIVIGMLADKPVEQVLSTLAPYAAQWIVVGLDADRALPPTDLAAIIRQQQVGESTGTPIEVLNSVAAGCAVARARARPGDRVVVTGSFHSVGPALAWLGL